MRKTRKPKTSLNRKTTVVRSYKLRVYGNPGKLEIARYTHNRFCEYVAKYVGPLFFLGPSLKWSTEGLGQLANQAQHYARGVVRALREAQAATGNKTNVPQITTAPAPVRLESAKTAESFDYWVSVSNQWTKGGGVKLPLKSHQALNKKLRGGWKLSKTAGLHFDRYGHGFVTVYVSRPLPAPKERPRYVGVDVGYRNLVTTSDGYVAPHGSQLVKRDRKANAERQRQAALAAKRASGPTAIHQGPLKSRKTTKSNLKQQLNREARRVLARCQRSRCSLAVENPSVLANLTGRGLQGWASAYFGRRCLELGPEYGVFVRAIDPRYTSQKCSECGCVDKQNRCGRDFRCVACGHMAHADVNAAINIATEGTVERVRERPRSGTVASPKVGVA
jgi:transposase